MQAFELYITGDGSTTNTRFEYMSYLDWVPSPNSIATWNYLE